MLNPTPQSKEAATSPEAINAVKFSRTFHKTTWLPLSALCNKWANAQRTFNEKHAAAIAKELDPDLFGVIIVTLPDGRGKHHIIDGQHRVEAARRVIGDDQRVPCQVLDIADPVRAAQVFFKQNSRRRGVTSIDKFLVQVTGKSPLHVSINKVVEDLGYKVSLGPSAHNIRAVDALITVTNKFSLQTLQATLATIHSIWGKDGQAMAAHIIIGFGYALGEHNEAMDRARLVARMEKKWTPRRLLARAEGIVETAHISKGAAVRNLILETYNANLRGGRVGNGKAAIGDIE